MISKIKTPEGDLVTVTTKQFSNGLLVSTIPETDLPSAAYGTEDVYHEKFRNEMIDEGCRVVGGDKLPNGPNATIKMPKKL